MPTTDRILSAEQAARLIYNTRAPSSEQIEKIKTRIDRGALERGPRGGYTTTASAVADYMARHVAAATANEHKEARRFKDGEAVPALYKDLLKDYFLAVLMQRTARRRTAAFNAAVIGFQVALILVPLVAFWLTYSSTVKAMIKPPQRVAAERWLDENFDDYEITQLQPLDEPAGAFRLRFWYSQQGSKRIQSVRILEIDGDRVLTATMPE